MFQTFISQKCQLLRSKRSNDIRSDKLLIFIDFQSSDVFSCQRHVSHVRGECRWIENQSTCISGHAHLIGDYRFLHHCSAQNGEVGIP